MSFKIYVHIKSFDGSWSLEKFDNLGDFEIWKELNNFQKNNIYVLGGWGFNMGDLEGDK